MGGLYRLRLPDGPWREFTCTRFPIVAEDDCEVDDCEEGFVLTQGDSCMLPRYLEVSGVGGGINDGGLMLIERNAGFINFKPKTK